jgi:PAS domain S-box-containing protein
MSLRELESTDVAPGSMTNNAALMLEVLESITDAFSVLDEDMRVIFINDAAAKLIGVKREDILGRTAWELIPESKDTSFTRAQEEALRERRKIVVEDYFAPWDRWFEASIFPLRHGISVYTRDVTVRKRAELLRERLASHAALRADVSAALAAERDIRKMLQRSCEAIVRHLDAAFARVWTVDDAGETLLLQASAGMYTHIDGGHAAVPVGSYKIGLIAAERQPHLTNDVLHDPRVGNHEWAKRERMVSFAGYPLVVDDRLVGVMALFGRQPLPEETLLALSGISDALSQGIVRRRTEIELEQRIADLARSNAELEQFAYVASHDLQEPLRMVSSYNQLLARRYKGKLDADADEFIGYTVEGATRMQRLINDLLAYSRVGTRAREFGEVDLEKVFAATLQNLEHAVADENATVTHDPLPIVTGDEGQLGQVLQNLVANALKFHGPDAPRIHVGVRQEADANVVFVRDNGIGIDPQYFDRIFIIFQRLHPREKYPGTGIGLAICKKIVERHGGKIWVESPPGGGTTVFFSIPKAPPRRWRIPT